MGGVFSAAVDAVQATKNDAQQRSTAADATAADWSGLPQDLLLDIPNLFRSSAALKQAPCLLYACDEYGPNEAALYCPSTNATFRVPFPGPPHERRGFVFSCHGWVFAADEVGDPYLFNPTTGVQAALPPVKTIMVHDDNFYDDQGRNVFNFDSDDENGDRKTGILWARDSEYIRIAVSSAADVNACTVLILHNPDFKLSFAKPGDKQWTLLSDIQTGDVSDVLYNDKDGLFYVLHNRASISAVDLNGPQPRVTMTMRPASRLRISDMYLVVAPSGELLHVWRMRDTIDTPLKNRATYKDIVPYVIDDRIELASENGSDRLTETDIDDHQHTDAEELPDNEANTTEVLVFRVDMDRQKLVELRDIGDYSIFLGLNAAVCLSTKDTTLEPNCIYLTDDFDHPSCNPMLRKDVGIWNIKKRSMPKLGDVWPIMHSWLDLPAPICITPSLASAVCLAPPIAGRADTTAPRARRRSGRRRVRRR